MSSEQVSQGAARVHARKIGGIDEADVELAPGVTVLSGRNATNRTSLLQAIMAACGSDRVSLKGDANEGRAELELGDETYSRTLTRTDSAVALDGEPYLDDPELADLFAFLLESNEARRAVERGDDLRELIMRPVDTEAIQADVERLQAEKRGLDDELATIDDLKNDLPALEERKQALEREIEDEREALAAKEAELEAADTDVEETRQEKSELDEKLADLRETRSALEDVRFEIDTERESIESLENERAELEAELDELPGVSARERSEIEADLERLRSRKQEVESAVANLQSTIQFNEEMLEGGDADVLAALSDAEGADDSGALTEQLLGDAESVVCWTCGSTVERPQIETTLDQLRELREGRLAESREIRGELEELKDEQRTLEERRDERDRLDRKLDAIAAELEERKARLADLQDERDALAEDIETLEAEVENLREEDFSAVLELHREANQLEFELGRLEGDREDVEAEIGRIEGRLAERERVERQRDEVQSGLEELRTRIDRIEQAAVAQFNEHMEAVLDILDYANLARVWIERVEREVREGRRKVTTRVFELHVVRRTASGTTYEDTVDHLSESEREVTGLVFALAGYLVHDVHETVPFMLLDSLEAIDADRIAGLIAYIEEYADYLVVALLPEDAAALDEEYHRVTEI